MSTISGGSKPEFTGNEVLQASKLNLATHHWVATEVPDDSVGRDGDIVFVPGDSAPNSELPGIGGWTNIAYVESPTNDIPAYTDVNGMAWKAWSWENPKVLSSGSSQNPTRDLMGSVTLAEKGLVEVLIVAAGGSGYSNSGGGGAGGVIATVIELPKGKNDIYVGSGSRSTTPGGGSSVGPIGISGGSYREPGDSGNGFDGYSALTPGAGAAGNAYFDYDPGYNKVHPGPGITLNWADGVTDSVYGHGGDYSTSAAQPPGYGDGGTMQPSSNTGKYNPGANGFVLVRVPAENADGTTVTAMSNETKIRVAAETKFQEESNKQQQLEKEQGDE
jgi:hypothetical protein